MQNATRFPARNSEVGGLGIRRALPVAGKRLIGAWCFLDHIGPAKFSDPRGLRVGPHPHIGLQTFTWMIDGEILHRDSLGYVQHIRPGQVNLMTAGHGIAHSEESPQPHSPHIQAAQLWIALPDRLRNMPPAFAHHHDIPVFVHEGFTVSLPVGEFLGHRSPVEVHTPLVGVDLLSAGLASVTLPLRADFEYGVLVLEGSAEVDDERLEPGVLHCPATGAKALTIRTTERARLLLIGGEPLNENVLLFWNWVARDASEIADVTRLWNAGDARFGSVRGYDGERLLAPEPPAGMKPAR